MRHRWDGSFNCGCGEPVENGSEWQVHMWDVATRTANEVAAGAIRDALDATHRRGEWQTRQAVLAVAQRLETNNREDA